jgi:hypothetical protein
MIAPPIDLPSPEFHLQGARAAARLTPARPARGE